MYGCTEVLVPRTSSLGLLIKKISQVMTLDDLSELPRYDRDSNWASMSILLDSCLGPSQTLAHRIKKCSECQLKEYVFLPPNLTY